MRLTSLLKRRQKSKRPLPPVEEPRVSASAIKRALRHTAAMPRSHSATIQGQRVATALSTIETAVLAIDVIADRLREAAGLVSEAGKTDNLGRRALLAGRFDDVRSEIDATVGSASHNRINLINGMLIGGQSPAFDIALDVEGRAGIAISIVNLTTGARGLALSPPRTAFAEDAEINMILEEIDRAQLRISEVGLRFADHAALVADRLARLQKLAGSRPILSDVPTGADITDPALEPASLSAPLDLLPEQAEPASAQPPHEPEIEETKIEAAEVDETPLDVNLADSTNQGLGSA
jgi:acid phosphatase family membrane protein YuiD